MNPSIQEKVSYWLSGPFDAETKRQVKALIHDEQALEEAFGSDLSFGTGGLRAIMGVGTNRLNIYTIRRASQGLANYLKKHFPSPSCVIGFDSRHHSFDFAKEAARVLALNGVTAYLLPELRPTPYLSFACREKKASAGIMITASHNPKEYNGFKVYGSDGAQVVFPTDEKILKEMEQVIDFFSIPGESEKEVLLLDLKKLDQAYLKAIYPLKRTQEKEETLKIVYTSLHGTGITMIPKALASWGFTSIINVEKQITIDGNFPTAPSPNPENPKAMQMAIEKLVETESDIAIASDPDADRIGIVVLHQGKPFLLSGNEIAALCAEFLCKYPHPKNSAIITTIVTTELLKKISQKYNLLLIETLTGFKYIGEKINLWQQDSTSPYFLFGAEESYGYLIGTHARDKDGIVSSCLISQMALNAKLQGNTLVDQLYELYKEYGVFREQQASFTFANGLERMNKVMQEMREHPPKHLAGKQVIFQEDYKTGIKRDLVNNTKTPLSLPVSDVLLFRLEDRSRLVMRPSGTEPKLKLYAGVESSQFLSIKEGIQECDQRLETYIAALKQHCHL